MKAAPRATSPRSVHLFRDADELARSAAAAVADAAREAVAERGRFAVMLAGGATPRRLYEALARGADVDWARSEVFFGDERPVPPDHADSNFGMARAALLRPLAVPSQRVHRIQAERRDLEAAARDYEDELARVLGGAPGGPAPRLDVVLLGLGADGHTASLFPHSAALAETRRWVVAHEVPALASWRITVTFPVLERARAVFFLVSGEAKAATLAEVLEGPSDPERLPSQRLHAAQGRVEWFVDAAAASRLREPAHERP